jgi:hypothetical protein
MMSPRMLGVPSALDKVKRRHGDPMHLGPERLREIIGHALTAGSFVVCHDTLTYGLAEQRLDGLV